VVATAVDIARTMAVLDAVAYMTNMDFWAVAEVGKKKLIII